MQEYLLAGLISSEDSPAGEPELVQKKIVKIIGEFGGRVLVQESREQALVFPIKKQIQAILIKTFLSLDPSEVLKLTKELDHESAILRFLLVKFPYTKVKLGNEAKVERVKRQTKTEAASEVSKPIKVAKKKLVKKTVKVDKKEKAEELDKALAKILKE